MLDGQEHAYAKVKIKQGNMKYPSYIEVDPAVLQSYQGSGLIDNRFIIDRNNVMGRDKELVEVESISISRPGAYDVEGATDPAETINYVRAVDPTTNKAVLLEGRENVGQSVQDTYLDIDNYLNTGTKQTTLDNVYTK